MMLDYKHSMVHRSSQGGERYEGTKRSTHDQSAAKDSTAPHGTHSSPHFSPRKRTPPQTTSSQSKP